METYIKKRLKLTYLDAKPRYAPYRSIRHVEYVHCNKTGDENCVDYIIKNKCTDHICVCKRVTETFIDLLHMSNEYNIAVDTKYVDTGGGPPLYGVNIQTSK